MIHPINIPDDLLAVNPIRPQLLEPRRRAKISYSTSGRRFNMEEPITPKAPVMMWNDFFLRTFIHRVACNSSDSSDKCSMDSLIDIVDLQLADMATRWEGRQQEKRSPCHEGDKTKLGLLNMPGNQQTDRTAAVDEAEANESNDQFEKELDALEKEMASLTRIGSSVKRLQSNLRVSRLRRGESVRVKRESFESILRSCCLPSEDGEAIFKEFARFDFSHFNLFDHAGRCKEGCIGVPNSMGSRLWTSARGKPGSEERPEELIFNTEKVHWHPENTTGTQIDIHLSIYNPSAKEIGFEIEQHVHEAREEGIGRLVSKSRYMHILTGTDCPLCLRIIVTEEVKQIFTDPNQFLVVTLHGRTLY